MGWVKGQSGNKAGRPKGILDKRLRLNKSLMVDGGALLAVTKAPAMAGDMTAIPLLLARMMPTLEPEGSPIRFALDASLDTSKQTEQVLQALVGGRLNVDETKQIAELVRHLAEAGVSDGAGDSSDKLSAMFRKV